MNQIQKFWQWITVAHFRRALTVASAWNGTGGVDRALTSLAPAMVARSSNVDPVSPLALVPTMALGKVLLQWPIVILADRYVLRKKTNYRHNRAFALQHHSIFLNSIFSLCVLFKCACDAFATLQR